MTEQGKPLPIPIDPPISRASGSQTGPDNSRWFQLVSTDVGLGEIIDIWVFMGCTLTYPSHYEHPSKAPQVPKPNGPRRAGGVHGPQDHPRPVVGVLVFALGCPFRRCSPLLAAGRWAYRTLRCLPAHLSALHRGRGLGGMCGNIRRGRERAVGNE